MTSPCFSDPCALASWSPLYGERTLLQVALAEWRRHHAEERAEAEFVEAMTPAEWVAWLQPYTPPPTLRRLAEARPEIEWLCWLEPEERAFHAAPHNVARLIRMFPNVEEDEWLTVLR